MKLYSLNRGQFVPAPADVVWKFFSNPNNLSMITPGELNFRVLTKNLPEKIYSGMLINYSLSPIFGIRIKWMTEIKEVREDRFFIDEQRRGPYSFWRHKHTFIPSAKGTFVKDEIEYALPFSFLGALVHSIWVKKRLRDIFDFRSKIISQKFPLTIDSAA